MSTNKQNFFIEKLDSGYIVTIDYRRVAFTSSSDIEKMLKGKLEAMLGILENSNTYNMIVSLEVEENVPKSSRNE